MMEQWRTIPDFPRYNVSSLGRVRNTETGRDMKMTLNQHHLLYVGLMKDGLQYKRSVALLVANSYLNIPIHPSHDSVIHVDGNRSNCAASNLMWRPVSFAINYHKQCRDDMPAYIGTIYCPETEEVFTSSRDMAERYGLLERDIIYSIVHGVMIYPTKMTAQGR